MRTMHGTTGDRGILRRLREEHARLSALVRRLTETTDATERRVRFEEVRRELIAHGKGEEHAVYPVFEQFEDTADLIEELNEDHTAMEQALERLRSLNAETEEWAESVEDLMHDVLDHLAIEENELFPAAQQHLDEVRAEELEEQYLNSKAQVLRQVA